MRLTRWNVTAIAAALLVLGSASTASAGGIPVLYNTGEDAFAVAPINDEIFALAADSVMESVAKENGFDLAQVPAEDLASGKAEIIAEMKSTFEGMSVGWKCSVFGLFYAYMHWWSCEQVFFKETGANEFTYITADADKVKAEIAAKISDADTQKEAVLQVASLIAAFEKKAGGKKLKDAYPISDAKFGFWKKNGRFVLIGIVLLIIGLGVLKWWFTRKAEGAGAPPPGVFPPPGGGFPPPGGGAQFPPPGGGGFPPPGGGGFPPPGQGGFPPPGGGGFPPPGGGFPPQG